ncbi:MAG: universal stress protein [Myxococcales bacterium]|nr:universal stress protein [Myxococcales bacterium]MDD9966825.1 universal stress protein [Myxococcales bacterium]
MPAIQHIICATDFSDASRPAIEAAVQFAARFRAKLNLVHVLHAPAYAGWDDGPATAAVHSAFLDDLRKAAEEGLAEARKLASAVTDEPVELETNLVEGVPHQVLAEMSHEADLLVLGTHGRTGLQHLLIGSVAERTVRLSECPVLTIRPS